MPTVLSEELKYYEDHKQELLEHHDGQFVLIRHDELAGAFTTEAEAYEAGLNRFGNKPFLIRQVSEHVETAHFPALTLNVINVGPQ